MVSVVVANGWEGQKAVLESTDEFLALTGTPSTTGVTLHDGTTNYQVPTGKVLTLLAMFMTEPDAVNRTITVYSATAADGTTGEVDKYAVSYIASLGLNSLQYVPISGTLAADLFLNAKSSSASGTNPSITILAVEGDA